MAIESKLVNEFMTPKRKEEFKKRKEDIKHLKGMLAMFKEMGLDTKMLEEKIEWADKMLQVMTKHMEL